MIKYEKIDSKHTGIPTLFRFEYEFNGFLVVDENEKDTNDMFYAKCIIVTPHGRFSSVCKVNPEFLSDQEAIFVESVVESCISQYKKRLAKKHDKSSSAGTADALERRLVAVMDAAEGD